MNYVLILEWNVVVTSFKVPMFIDFQTFCQYTDTLHDTQYDYHALMPTLFGEGN